MFNRSRWTFILSLLLILSLAFSACGRDKAPEENTPADAPIATETVAQPTAVSPPAAVSPTATVQESASRAQVTSGDLVVGDLAELDSYRTRSVITPVSDPEGGAGTVPFLGGVTIIETEVVRDPAASHTLMMDGEGNVATELITVGGQSWMKVPGMGWMTAGPDQANMSSGMTPDVDEMVKQIAKDMKRVGQETVNGVNAMHYTIDSQYEIAFPQLTAEELAADPQMPSPSSVRGSVNGDIWIAAERNLPPVVVRSVTTQEVSFGFDEKPEMSEDMPPGLRFFFGEGTMTVTEERDVTDINQPITIEPPADAMDLGNLMPSPATLATPLASAAQEEQPETDAAEALTVAPLDSLDSYQATLTTTVTSNDMAVSTVVSEEWTADPPARRIWSDLGGMEIEYVITEEGAWVKMAGRWVSTEATEADDLRGDLLDYTEPTDDMTFVGNESVEGVNTRFYTRTDSMGGQTMVTEVWVADEPTLPPVVVKVRHTLQLQSILTVTEVLVTNINQPLAIEPPN